MHATFKALALAGLAVALFAAPAAAQVSNCQAIANNLPGAKIWRAATGTADPYAVEISYVGHSTFRIVAPDGTTIATDYSGTHGGDKLPDVVTMNHAHSSHWTPNPDPGIPHALKGWNPEGGRANHFLNVGEVVIRNVPSDIRSWGGTIEESGNSIFVFEIAGLCIGHLGHLHQELNDAQIAEIGRLDIVFVPIDGGRTMPHGEMMSVISRLRASLAIPMHWFSNYNLNEFAARTRADGLAVAMNPGPTLTVSLNTLPDMPTLLVMPREFPF
ncbi:MBL fold metallo-hydrolase [Acuticoccus sp. MNP-M23]|uniref:MBL fold metallo-hydrolase n=1 Tax=Acuticoccus sp. MNP-M23 TaxID=3072793 RepID=UPI002814F0A0|nr:MBL fold metallo-hydrolase [Acuticoccus sp. MNP-M23]WMS43312.1 MBL fold metallo-hydrolase [Acuticoccus sp. MNP-M23]